MAAGITRVRLQSRTIRIFGPGMVIAGFCRVMVFVRGRAVVMVRVIVSDVLVHVQRRAQGRRRDHGLDEHEGEQAAHALSLLRVLFVARRQCLVRLQAAARRQPLDSP